MPVLERLSDVLDESDPDVDVPNVHHAFQTAEGLRARHPHLPWLHLAGLIHDLGKVRPGSFLKAEGTFAPANRCLS